MRPGEGGRWPRNRALGWACAATLLLALGLLYLARLRSGRPGHASSRIQAVREPFPVSPDLQGAFEQRYREEDPLDRDALERLKYVQRIVMQVLLLNEIESMAELGCGALTWMEQVLRAYSKEDPRFRYLGLDIARPLVQRNKAHFAKETAWDFHVFDASTSLVPDHYELVFCRDLLQHLPLVAAVEALERVAQSGARLLLVGTYKTLTPQEHNKNVAVGEQYDMNLMSDPFNLVDPLAVYDENTYQMTKGTAPDKHLFLYAVADLKKLDWGSKRQRALALSQADS